MQIFFMSFQALTFHSLYGESFFIGQLTVNSISKDREKGMAMNNNVHVYSSQQGLLCSSCSAKMKRRTISMKKQVYNISIMTNINNGNGRDHKLLIF